MSEAPDALRPDWPGLVQRIAAELADLSVAEKAWLQIRLETIAELQTALDVLFAKAGGAKSCADCDGACCGCGRHHLTLTNLLASLLPGEVPPAPDFAKTCPFLGESGCCLPVTRRPYNCITFFCEQLEDSLGEDDRAQLRDLDKRLRQTYESVAERYPAASLRGIWIALARLDGGPILSRAE